MSLPACQRAINAHGVSKRSDALCSVSSVSIFIEAAQLVLGKVEARQRAIDEKHAGNMLGTCCPTNVGASAKPTVVSAQVKILESDVADKSITEELCAFLSQLVFGERQLRQRACDTSL